MKTLDKIAQNEITPQQGVELLKKGNQRFMANLKINRNLLNQMNETSESQHPFAVVISCMDSRTSAELIFDQGLGDIFSIRIAGNIINEDILGSTEFGCRVVGAKVVLVLGHSGCGAIAGAVNDVDLGHLKFITKKIQRCIPALREKYPHTTNQDLCSHVTRENIGLGINDLTSKSPILAEMVKKGEIKIVGGAYDITSGSVDFFDV